MQTNHLIIIQETKTMENLTIEQLKAKVSEPILIDVEYNFNSIIGEYECKCIRYHPIEQQYRIFQYYKEVNKTYIAETAIKYYNELTF